MNLPIFAGHCDGIQNGEIYGWALNASDTTQPVVVSVFLDGALATEVLAGYYRPDVASALECSGRNGFYVDLESLCQGEGKVSVDVRFPDGSSAHGSPVIYDARKKAPRKEQPTLLFMHIPKTAGTAFRELVLANYKQSQVAYIYGDPPGFPSTFIGHLPLGQRSHLRLVFGHYGYGLHQFMPNECDYAALIRDPLHRIWSHYTHLVRDLHPSVVDNGRPRRIEDVLADKKCVFLDNLYVRYLCGLEEREVPAGFVNHEIYESARTNVRKPNVSIVHQNDLVSAYNSLGQDRSWTPGLNCPRVNDSPIQSRPGVQEAAAIRHFNAWDFRLYEDMISYC
jgi:hypothetical protein